MKRCITWTLAGLSLWAILTAAWATPRAEAGSAPYELQLEADLQRLVAEKLAAHVEACGAKSGAAIVLDPAAGKVLARAGFRRDETTGQMVADEKVPFSMRFMGASTMKPLVVAAALQERAVTDSDLFDTAKGPLVLDGKTYHEWKEGGLGKLTPADVLVKSSNLGAIQIAQRLGTDRLVSLLEQVGYQVGKGAPIGDLSCGSHGGLSVSAYQVAYAYCILVGGGRDPRTGIAVVRPEVSDFIRKALVKAVEEGTGPQAKCKGLPVGGKTGTSVREVDGKKTGTAYFVGFAPADDPIMVISVIVNDVGSEVNGNRHAASLFPQIVEDGLPLLRRPKATE